ncbi:MAG: GTPase [Thermoguttaceae bacterium]
MNFQQLSHIILELVDSLDALKERAEFCGVPSPEHQEWYSLLKHKLLPQVTDQSFLIVAIMGGTNTGKSLVFNHLAGEPVSAVDFRASGTKHPVCLVPKKTKDSAENTSKDSANHLATSEQQLNRCFADFQVVSWSSPSQPLETTTSSLLFWKEGNHLPDNLWILDTPDIDSDTESNLEKARQIRHAADVLLVILTEQKYNDAVVRQFFREAVQAGKPVIVLVNMVDLETDKTHLMRWIEQFTHEIGAKPICSLVSPYLPESVNKQEIPFYIIESEEISENPTSLPTILSELHFDTIKSQTLLGALHVLNDKKTGVHVYLNEVEKASKRFAEALSLLDTIGETEVEWPGLPGSILADEIQKWWHSERPNWSQSIHHVYQTIGNGISWSLQKGHQITSMFWKTNSKPSDPLHDFHEAERGAVLKFVTNLIAQLEQLAETDNPVLRRELLELISGDRRAALFSHSHSVLDSMEPVDESFRIKLRSALSDWTYQHPQTIGWIRSIDNMATVARPVLTVSLAVTGAMVVGPAVAPAFGSFLGGVGGGVSGLVGNEAMFQFGEKGAQQSVSSLFRTIQEDFVRSRAKHFCETFRTQLWHDVLERLREGSDVSQSEAFLRCQNWNRDASFSS